MESDQAYGSIFIELLKKCNRLGLSLKMYRDCFHQEMETICGSSFEGWSNAGMAQHGGCLTVSISEWPKDADVVSLSEVLETDVAQKYYLSKKACQGILRRAEKRGKELPTVLKQALQEVANGQIEAITY